VLIDLLQRLNLHLIRGPATTLTAPGRWHQALAEHQALIAAIRDGDEAAAGDVARGHMRTARDIRLRMWRERAVTAGSSQSPAR
jgi:DNA-binding GntR family transcriptional regulator